MDGIVPQCQRDDRVLRERQHHIIVCLKETWGPADTLTQEAKVSTIAAEVAGFRDHYETLQLSPNADEETISRVFRILVKRYHPDNADTGNTKKFNEVMDAYRFLSDPEKRAAYDVRYEENRATVLKIFDEASTSDSFDTDERIFEGILSLLYIARRRDVSKGGMGVIQIERFLGCPSEHLEFHIWYLREKGWIERLDSGQISITATGVDRMMEQDLLLLRRNRLLMEKNPD